MNRQFNFRFTLGLAVVLAAVGGGLYLLHEWQVTSNAGTLKARSEKADADGDKWKAVSYLERYLGFRPGDKEAARRHATLLTEAAKARPEQQRAYLAVEQVLRDAPADTDLRRTAADLALQIDRPADAKYHLEELLKGKPGDADLLDKLGRCEEQLGRIDQAILRLEQAIKADPSRVDCYVRLARCYRRQERSDQADKKMAELVERNPTSAPAQLAKSRYEQDLGRIAEGAKASSAAVKLAPEDRQVILQAAEVAAQQGRQDDARAEFAKGRKLFPDDLRFVTGQATLDLTAGRRAEAVEALKLVAQKGTSRLEDTWLLANLFITAGEPVEARKLMTKLPRQGPAAAAAEFLDARLLMADQKWVAAAAALTRSRPGLVRDPELALQAELMLAACYERLDRADKRLEAAQQAVKLDPTAVAARIALADARQASGNIEEALTGYLQLAGRVPAARFTAAWLMIWQNRIRGSQAEWAVTEQLLAETPAELKKTADYRLLAATLAAVQGRQAEAKKLLEQGKADDPKERRYWVSLANMARADSGPAAAEKVLDEGVAAAGDGVDFRLARIQTRVAQGGPADRLKPLEAGIEGWPAEDQERLLVGLADGYTAVGARADARRLTDELVRRQPDSLVYQMKRFDLAVAAGAEVDQLTPLVDALRKLEGEDGAVWRYAEATRQTVTARRDNSPKAIAAARTLLTEVAGRRPEWAQVPLLEGELDERAGNPDAAVEKYLRAIRLGARSPALVRRAAGLLIARRRYDEARQLLADVPAVATAPDVRRVAAELAAATKEPTDDTLKLAIDAVPADTKNPADELWRGMILWSANQPAAAEKAFRRATELGGADPTNWGALIRFLALTDRKPEAGRVIAAAKGKVPADQLTLALPQWLDMVGDRAEAAKQYDALYRAAPGDPRVVRELVLFHMAGGEMDKAEPLLRGLTEKATDPLVAAWGRRTLALLLAVKGEYRYGTEALALVEANLKDRPESPEDQRVKAIVLSSRPGGRRQSITVLESSFARLRPAPAEEFLLAQLYEADGNWAKAKDRLLGLVSGSQAKNPQYLAFFITALLRHKEVDAAAEWLARLEAEAADAPRTVEMKARVLAAKGQATEAADLLGGFAEKLYASRSNNPMVYRAVGLLMAELKLTGPAEGLIRKYVAQAEAKNPVAALDLAEFLARQDRVSDALGVVAKAAGRGVPPEVVGRATVAVVRLGKPAELDFVTAAGLLAAARKAAPGAADLPVSTADLLDARGQYPEAIAAYRDILAKDPGKAIALNNLAWLLALHEKKPDEALALVERAIGVVGPQYLYLDTRGMIHLRSDKPEQAIRDFTAALEQAQRPDTLFHLALAYDKMGNATDARRWFKRAAEAGLTDKDLHPLEVSEYRRLKGLFGS